MRLIPFALLLVASSLQAANAPATADSAALYQQHCQSCHGLERLGGAGPALLPESSRAPHRPSRWGALAARSHPPGRPGPRPA